MSLSLVGVSITIIIVGNITTIPTIVGFHLQMNTHSVLLQRVFRGATFSTILALEWFSVILRMNICHVMFQTLHKSSTLRTGLLGLMRFHVTLQDDLILKQFATHGTSHLPDNMKSLNMLC